MVKTEQTRLVISIIKIFILVISFFVMGFAAIGLCKSLVFQDGVIKNEGVKYILGLFQFLLYFNWYCRSIGIKEDEKE